MKFKIFSGLVILLQVCTITSVDLDLIDCGIDHALDVAEGDVDLSQYPWLGVLYYSYFGQDGDSRSITTVILIQKEFVLAPAADIGPMPKIDFRKKSRVLLGLGWARQGRRVRSYVIHPEYGETRNTVALVQLRDPVRDISIRPPCPPPNFLRNPVFYVIKMKEEFDNLEKEVVSVMHIPGKMCKDFYVATNLYTKLMRPPHVACAVSVKTKDICVWGAGAALVSRDVWGRWQLLGMGVRGPGCGAPSRYLDMMSYYPWIESSLAKFNRITISKINKQKYVLRSSHAIQKFGACDPGETVNLVYREVIVLRTNNNQYQFLTYNLSVVDNVEFTCLTMELTNASGSSEMRVKHFCPRNQYGQACYTYKGSRFEISVYLMFSDTCLFEMVAWGFHKNMSLLDIHEWKWEEGSYYEDFTIKRVEYRGQTYMTDFGYEPLDIGMWVPDYDVWTTTEVDNSTTMTPPPINVSRTAAYRITTTTTARKTKKTPRRKTKTTTEPIITESTAAELTQTTTETATDTTTVEVQGSSGDGIESTSNIIETTTATTTTTAEEQGTEPAPGKGDDTESTNTTMAPTTTTAEEQGTEPTPGKGDDTEATNTTMAPKTTTAEQQGTEPTPGKGDDTEATNTTMAPKTTTAEEQGTEPVRGDGDDTESTTATIKTTMTTKTTTTEEQGTEPGPGDNDDNDLSDQGGKSDPRDEEEPTTTTIKTTMTTKITTAEEQGTEPGPGDNDDNDLSDQGGESDPKDEEEFTTTSSRTTTTPGPFGPGESGETSSQQPDPAGLKASDMATTARAPWLLISFLVLIIFCL